ncbi:hypothetical protein ACFRCG_20805 [Embleya sp. NPDC056575]|uniref:hypothetical protein n=1 Tax=unclassified Embleya TaxID=2699296 RepID=UPI0036C8296E
MRAIRPHVTDDAFVRAAAAACGLDVLAEVIVRMACLGPGGSTGGYFDADGTLPW